MRRVLPDGRGTPFQRRVWRLAMAIPRGQTRSYGWMARKLRTSPRAVGQALRANPFAPRVPCHRVISADGSLGGFGGRMNSAKKRRMLAGEGVRCGR
jgi:methylated-DNA-[protein]-cysteine S-methyltransferase